MEPVNLPHHSGAGIFVTEDDGEGGLYAASKSPTPATTTSGNSSSPWQKRSSTFLPTTSFASRPSQSSSTRLAGSAASLPVFRHCSALPEYFWRVLDYRQMDLEATYYQMVTLCISPTKVYKSAYYRKQTKNRWARDDPAFAVIQVLQYLPWAFLHVACTVFVLLPWLLSSALGSLVLANTLYAIGCGSYVYITFLGYMGTIALPFLHHTERFLYPIVAIGGLYLSSVVLKLVFGATVNVALVSATARRRAGMDNIFTGETCEQATEKHNLRMDYAAVLQEQIRLQNAKKEQIKQQKLDEQRLEREEMVPSDPMYTLAYGG
ncbi:hypothetical protein DYB30_010640 [Aphanomyces astaci]|uniref:Uncharacterized protein n=2 Tax=Aphanomyces astaci TaxID=112090 RepID=A0A397DT12_APHAT|nr:hypothetical protein DYB30_010640 [Aphanomyces astaci]